MLMPGLRRWPTAILQMKLTYLQYCERPVKDSECREDFDRANFPMRTKEAFEL